MKGWWTEESLGAILIHLWMTAHVMCLSATITEALTRGVGPCEVSISACVPNYVIWKGQRHIKAKLRSLQPLLQLYRRLLMHSDATAGKEDWMWIIISTKGSCAVCACVLNAYKCEPFSSSQKPPPLMYYTEQRPEWSRVGWKRSEGIMHFCSPHWRCIEFYFSQWLDKITFKSLSFYCDWFFFSEVSTIVPSNRSCESILQIHDARLVAGSVTLNLLLIFPLLFISLFTRTPEAQ